MPLHDWTDRAGWDGVHHLWIGDLLDWIQPRLPEGYRAYIGTAPTLAVGAPTERPDVGVRLWPQDAPGSAPPNGADQSGEPMDEPDEEIAVAVAALDVTTALFVESKGNLVAAIELILPRNKDRYAAQTSYLSRYLGYLFQGVHLLLIDVHRRPLNFSFADRINQELGLERPSCPAPFAVSYRVGEPAASGGRLLAFWRRPLVVNHALPQLPLALSVHASVTVDLESTYQRAAKRAYLA
ncbi:MAG: DUF4058 family protein [Gemmataceae bacterium]|nr:DUF4058 family protein [Gemmataceae bacterium]